MEINIIESHGAVGTYLIVQYLIGVCLPLSFSLSLSLTCLEMVWKISFPFLLPFLLFPPLLWLGCSPLEAQSSTDEEGGWSSTLDKERRKESRWYQKKNRGG